MDLLPALHYVRQELCNFNKSPLDSSGFSSLPPATNPAQAVAECVAAVDPLRRIFASMDEEGERRCQSSVAAEVEAAQRERRARALADTCKSTIDERMALSKELAQERKNRQDLEEKLGELTQGLCQLDQMLQGLKDSASLAKSDVCEEDAASDEASQEEKSQPMEHLRQMERALASCTLSAGVWLGRRRGSSTCSSSPVPVLSRALSGSRASTMTPCSSDSCSGESEDSEGEPMPTAANACTHWQER